MLTKWFIRDKTRKAKGYFTEFSSYRGWNTGKNSKPSYTKQTALAPSFNTEEEAEQFLRKLKGNILSELRMARTKIRNIKNLEREWKTLDVEERIAKLANCDITLEYEDGSRGWNGRPYKTRVNLYYGYGTNRTIRAFDELSDKEQEAIRKNAHDWSSSLKAPEGNKVVAERRLEELKRLVTEECTIEIKFMDKERKKIEWSVRGDNETKYSYCNGCGGAVPGIPQVKIGYEVRLCAICMGKLAQEALIQADKIPEEVMEHYETDRFLRQV